MAAAADLTPPGSSPASTTGYTYVYGMRYCEILPFKNVLKDRLFTANVYSELWNEMASPAGATPAPAPYHLYHLMPLPQTRSTCPRARPTSGAT